MKFTPMTFAKVSKDIIWNGLRRLIPALFTRTSILPKRFSVLLISRARNLTYASITLSTAWWSVRSHTVPSASAPSALHRLTVSMSLSWSRSTKDTLAPAFAKAIEIPRPIPPPAPVTNTVLPLNFPLKFFGSMKGYTSVLTEFCEGAILDVSWDNHERIELIVVAAPAAAKISGS
jgi:hypothetical protein